MNNSEMAEFILSLRDRNEMPINEDEYYLLGEIADALRNPNPCANCQEFDCTECQYKN